MAKDQSKSPRPFDVETIRYLVRLMSRFELSEVELQEGEQRIRLRRGPKVVAAPLAAGPIPQAAAAAAAPTATAPAASAPQNNAEPARGKSLIEIKSQTVGTFYAQEKPGAPPYVTVGSRVTPSTVVGKIEAMKVFNDIEAGCSGVIREILVENGQYVDFDQVLFRVDPTA